MAKIDLKSMPSDQLEKLATECYQASRFRLSELWTGHGLKIKQLAEKLLPKIERELLKRGIHSYLKIIP